MPAWCWQRLTSVLCLLQVGPLPLLLPYPGWLSRYLCNWHCRRLALPGAPPPKQNWLPLSDQSPRYDACVPSTPSHTPLRNAYPPSVFTLPLSPPTTSSSQPIHNSPPHPQTNSRLSHNLRILQWNAGGLSSSHRAELIAFLSGNQYDLIFLQETHLSATKKFQIPGYYTLRTDRTFGRQSPVSSGTHNTGGGVLTLIHSDLAFSPVSVSSLSSQDPYSDYTCVKVLLSNHSPLQFLNLYSPPIRSTPNSRTRTFYPRLRCIDASRRASSVISRAKSATWQATCSNLSHLLILVLFSGFSMPSRAKRTPPKALLFLVALPRWTLPTTMPFIFAHIYLKQHPVPRAEPNDSSWMNSKNLAVRMLLPSTILSAPPSLCLNSPLPSANSPLPLRLALTRLPILY